MIHVDLSRRTSMKTEGWGGGRVRVVTKVDGGSAFIKDATEITQSECY
jgi:hypothetical protein